MKDVIITSQSCGCQDYNEVRIAFGDLHNCQLKCPFCFTLEQKISLENLSNLSKKNLTKTKIIRFTGGEPLLYQEQIDLIGGEIGKLEQRELPNLELVVIQTNAIAVENRNINELLKFKLPMIFEVSLKGTNVSEYQYLTNEHFLSKPQAEDIFKRQINGYNILEDKCKASKNISVLARLGIFHSSVTKPTFKLIFPDTQELMFNPAYWSPEFKDINTDQRKLWGSTFEGKMVVEKLKTPADGSPGMGKRYRNIIENLKKKKLLQESESSLPKIYQEYYLYKRGNEIYWRCAKKLSVV